MAATNPTLREIVILGRLSNGETHLVEATDMDCELVKNLLVQLHDGAIKIRETPLTDIEVLSRSADSIVDDKIPDAS